MKCKGAITTSSENEDPESDCSTTITENKMQHNQYAKYMQDCVMPKKMR